MSDMPKTIAELTAEWRSAGLLPDPATAPPPPTQEELDQRTREIVRAQRLARFAEVCPRQFRARIQRELLPNLEAWDKADAWDGTSPGLWLWSHETGRGKTRMAWRHYGRQHVERGRNVIKASGQALAEEYFRYHMDGEPRGFYRWLHHGQVLVLDDLDKVDYEEPRYARMMRELWDEIYAHQWPVLVTANEPISYFRDILGASCVRRMTEATREVQF
ncbi:MAG: ATP-binding protein [Proteobacteria bacterium]|nr:ATP-binding protein [Pseudomonadota bacterium]